MTASVNEEVRSMLPPNMPLKYQYFYTLSRIADYCLRLPERSGRIPFNPEFLKILMMMRNTIDSGRHYLSERTSDFHDYSAFKSWFNPQEDPLYREGECQFKMRVESSVLHNLMYAESHEFVDEAGVRFPDGKRHRVTFSQVLQPPVFQKYSDDLDLMSLRDLNPIARFTQLNMPDFFSLDEAEASAEWRQLLKNKFLESQGYPLMFLLGVKHKYCQILRVVEDGFGNHRLTEEIFGQPIVRYTYVDCIFIREYRQRNRLEQRVLVLTNLSSRFNDSSFALIKQSVDAAREMK